MVDCCVHILVMKVFSRYFVFTRVNPRPKEYASLLETCQKFDICLSYRTKRDVKRGRSVLTGFLVLRGPRTYADVLGRLFPNFLVAPLSGRHENGFDWMRAYGGDHLIDDEPVFFDCKEHPYASVKKRLF